MSKVVEQLNKIQADAWALTLKFHNYHWNVKGNMFHAVHVYTEKAYDDFFELFDAVAERAIMIGGKAIVCPKKITELSEAPECKKDDFSCSEICSLIKADYEYLLKEFKKLRKAAEEADDSTTQALAEDNIAKYEKEIWMLNQTIA